MRWGISAVDFALMPYSVALALVECTTVLGATGRTIETSIPFKRSELDRFGFLCFATFVACDHPAAVLRDLPFLVLPVDGGFLFVIGGPFPFHH